MTTSHKGRIRYRNGDTCPVPGCIVEITENGAMTCYPCLHVISSMCRGKERQDEQTARQIQERRPGLPAYQCAVCDEWHNGSAIPDPERRLEYARRVRTYMVDAYGMEWWQYWVVSRWNPHSGHFTRKPGVAAAR